MVYPAINTPALLVSLPRLEENIQTMQTLAHSHNAGLRPHIKTHKSTHIAGMQMAAGARGITVAKLSEAEVMADAGIHDIFIANQITHPLKIKKLAELTKKAHIIIGLDHPDQIALLADRFADASVPLEVRIEIDSGLHRCGVIVGEQLTRLARQITLTPWLKLEGLFTHAGQVYASKTTEDVRKTGVHEADVMEEACTLLNKHGIDPGTVSVGSTPTAPYAVRSGQVNEIRPGNYVFYDGIQKALGVCTPEQCSLFVLASVIAHPAPNRIVIDAGSKALNLDRGAQSLTLLKGYGEPLNIRGCITRLSEEHGILETDQTLEKVIGNPALILPNHACAVSNLFEYYHLIGPESTSRIPVSARAKSQ